MISAGYLEYDYLELFAFRNLFMVPSLYFALYLKLFLSKSTTEKRVLNKKALLFKTTQINNQLQYKVDQHLRQSVKQLTIENVLKMLMKL